MDSDGKLGEANNEMFSPCFYFPDFGAGKPSIVDFFEEPSALMICLSTKGCSASFKENNGRSFRHIG